MLVGWKLKLIFEKKIRNRRLAIFTLFGPALFLGALRYTAIPMKDMVDINLNYSNNLNPNEINHYRDLK